MDGKTVPLRTQPHEEVIEDGVRSHPRLAAGHVGVALRLMPLDVRAHRPENRGNISAAECVVEALQKRYVVHVCRDLAARRMLARSSGCQPSGRCDLADVVSGVVSAAERSRSAELSAACYVWPPYHRSKRWTVT